MLQTALKPHFQTSLSNQKRKKNMKLWCVQWSLGDFSLFFLSAPSKYRCVLLLLCKVIPPLLALRSWTTLCFDKLRNLGRKQRVHLWMQVPGSCSAPNTQESWARSRGTSVWQVCVLSYKCAPFQKALACWKPRCFSLWFFKCCCCVRRVAIAGGRVQVLLYVGSIYFSLRF